MVLKLIPFLKNKNRIFIRIITWNSIHLFTLLAVKTDKIELMIGDNLINDEHSIPIIITSDMIVKSFAKGYHPH